MTRLIVSAMLLAAAAGTAAVQKTKYGVEVQAEKNVDFAAFKTYSYTRSQPAADKTVDAQIVAAIEHELGALGMTKAASGPSDVIVTYFSLTRTDVDLQKKPNEKGVRPQYSVGTLIVTFTEPGSNRRLLRMRVDLPIDTQPDQLEAAINTATKALFAEYPAKRRK